MKLIATTAILAAALISVVHAENDYDDIQTAGEKPSLSIGGGLLVRPDYSGADTYKTDVLPIIAARKEVTPGNIFYIRGLQAGVDHELSPGLTIGALGNYRMGRDSSDSSRLAGMEDIDGAFEVGPKVRYQINPLLGVQATALFDVTDASNGYTARGSADFTMPLSEITFLTFEGGLNYGSSNFNNTYYGVKGSQAIVGRPAYRADSGLTDIDTSVTLRHRLTQHWSLMGRAGVDFLIADVADSPLVDQEYQPTIGAGIAYTF